MSGIMKSWPVTFFVWTAAAKHIDLLTIENHDGTALPAVESLIFFGQHLVCFQEGFRLLVRHASNLQEAWLLHAFQLHIAFICVRS